MTEDDKNRTDLLKIEDKVHLLSIEAYISTRHSTVSSSCKRKVPREPSILVR
jgi:hypothetical protein